MSCAPGRRIGLCVRGQIFNDLSRPREKKIGRTCRARGRVTRLTGWRQCNRVEAMAGPTGRAALPSRSAQASRSRRSRATYRPRLEALEDRCVPAIWFVNSNADDIMQGGTLRWAAAHAQNGDTIEILPTDNGAGRHIVLTHGELLLNQEVTIEAVGPAATIDGNNSSRIFEVSPRPSVTLDNLFIVNGDAKAHAGFIANFDGDGGAILNEGWLTLDTCVVENNGTNGDGRVNVAVKKGGGIYNYGPNA